MDDFVDNKNSTEHKRYDLSKKFARKNIFKKLFTDESSLNRQVFILISKTYDNVTKNTIQSINFNR